MLRRHHNLNLIDEKPRKLAAFRAILLVVTLLMLVLVVTGVVVFSCVHGTKIS